MNHTQPVTEQTVGPTVGQVESCLVEFNQPFITQSGEQIEAPWKLAYETYGELNHDKSNVVMVFHALSGSHHAAGYYMNEDDSRTYGWWDNMIGPDKPIDTNLYYVICVNVLGGCHGSTGPSSIRPSTSQAYGSSFPAMLVDDWIESQRLLLAHLGISQLYALVGGSIGGMQALSWALKYPQDSVKLLVIASAPRLSTTNIALNDVARQAILADEHFLQGDYYGSGAPVKGLRVARMLAHVTYLSEDKLARKFGRARKIDSEELASLADKWHTRFEVESYLRYQGDKFSRLFDANTYMLMTRALDEYDPAAAHQGDLRQTLATITAKTMFISFSTDWRFSAQRSREMVYAMLQNAQTVSYADIPSDAGHDSFLLDNSHYHQVVSVFLNAKPVSSND